MEGDEADGRCEEGELTFGTPTHWTKRNCSFTSIFCENVNEQEHPAAVHRILNIRHHLSSVPSSPAIQRWRGVQRGPSALAVRIRTEGDRDKS
ncbi:hypothetical protein EVAR_79515_1 [Eumeta japonica]|uniref:Uncharacterized protein n=1 Tax=Eumeta variegata TaxID=151549 RepID=A0A4C1UFA6_EUMVA|nr:hypothetical protein EVAR_79515_1 [Eumeta japonica]